MTSPDNNTFIIERLLEITEKEVFYFQQSKIRVIILILGNKGVVYKCKT